MSISYRGTGLYTVEVRSSSLLVPTTSFKGLAVFRPFFRCSKTFPLAGQFCFLKSFPLVLLVPMLNHINADTGLLNTEKSLARHHRTSAQDCDCDHLRRGHRWP